MGSGLEARGNVITLVVFSKDRAMQLDSLLRSVKDHCTGIDNVAVIAKASNQFHEMAYAAMDKTFPGPDVVMVLSTENTPEHLGAVLGHFLGIAADGRFRPLRDEDAAYIDTIRNQQLTHIALAVDDQFFYAPSDFAGAAEALDQQNAFVWSWRLGELEPSKFGGNCLPGVEMPSPSLPHWACSPLVADRDYGYVWHSDGALYKTYNYTQMLDRWLPDWRTGDYTPNDLEGLVAAKRQLWAPRVGPHLGPTKPTCITWQLNLARRDYASGSPAFELSETRLDALAAAYLAGKRVDNEQLYAALREDPLRFNLPGDRPTHVRACKEASRFWASAIR